MHISEFDLAPMGSLIISNKDLKEVEKWAVGELYDVTLKFEGAIQVRKTELEDGTFLVELIPQGRAKYSGNISKDSE